MEKTLKFQLDESYAEGYNNAREQIAKEIEATKCNNGKSCDGVNDEHCDTVDELIAIARGQNDPR